MYGIPCPNYIRSVKICNSSSEPFIISVTFKSGKTSEVKIDPQWTRTIEENTQSGTAWFVDEIVKVDGHRQSEPHKAILHFVGSDANGIEKRYYEVKSNFTVAKGVDPAQQGNAEMGGLFD